MIQLSKRGHHVRGRIPVECQYKDNKLGKRPDTYSFLTRIDSNVLKHANEVKTFSNHVSVLHV